MKCSVTVAVFSSILLSLASSPSVRAETAERPNGGIWRDVSGAPINAHGGALLRVGETWWWYGEHKTEGGEGNRAHVGVHAYSSTNLLDWVDRGIAFKVATAAEIAANPALGNVEEGCILERPKVVRAQDGSRYVMYFHLEPKGKGYSGAMTGIAQAAAPEGPFALVWTGRPNAGVAPVNAAEDATDGLSARCPWGGQAELWRAHLARGQMSRDMTLFTDPASGIVYHVFASENNSCLHIAELRADGLGYTGKWARLTPGDWTEAPALVRHGDWYFLLGSGCTGWRPNAARYYRAKSVWGPWERMGNPCRGKKAEITWGGQSTGIFETGGVAFAMFDLWRPSNAIDGRYVWVPIQFNDRGEMTIDYRETFTPKLPAPWEDPLVTEVNRLKARTTMRPVDKAHVLNLDGTWDFTFVNPPSPGRENEPEERRVGKIAVPGCWQLAAKNPDGTPMLTDPPQYVNITYPFANDPPRVTTAPKDKRWTSWRYRIPYGLYTKKVRLPADWAGRRVILRLNGYSSAVYVKVNGETVGYGEDGRLANEWDLTKVISKKEKGKSAELEICLTVLKHCDGSYLEDQDFWRLSGLFRSVELVSEPMDGLYDFNVNTRVSALVAGVIQVAGSFLPVEAAPGNVEAAPGNVEEATRNVEEAPHNVEEASRLLSKEVENSSTGAGEDACSTAGAGEDACFTAGAGGDACSTGERGGGAAYSWKLFDDRGDEVLRGVGHEELTLPDVHLWSRKAPYLYTLRVTCAGEAYERKVGFRTVAIEGGILKLNGERLLIHGVDRHEMSPYGGYAVTRAEMERDIAVMKRFNIDAVRTSHYADDPYWYELCDKAGIVVVAEANIECHGSGHPLRKSALSHNPAWRKAMLERNLNAVAVLRDHPSVIGWSVANESGTGANLVDAYTAVKAADPTRFVQYEGLFNPYPQLKFDLYGSDIICPMYETPAKVERALQKGFARPYILCEYAHAMGNSSGNLDEYWNLAEKYPHFQGGFIWDFADQALCVEGRLKYGGDFGDVPGEKNGHCNGLFDAFRAPHPGAYEVAYFYGGRKPVQSPGNVEEAPGNVEEASRLLSNQKSKNSPNADAFPAPRLSFYRAPTDNDRGNKLASKSACWRTATETGALPEGVTTNLVVARTAEGLFYDFTMKVAAAVPEVPRVGLAFDLPGDLSTRVAWHGAGPWENYADRACSAVVGDYQMNVAELDDSHYVRPQECGHRTKTTRLKVGKWVFSSVEGAEKGAFEWNVLPWSVSALEGAAHAEDLPSPDGTLHVFIDAAMRGVGGDDSWGAAVHAPYRLEGARTYRLVFKLSRED